MATTTNWDEVADLARRGLRTIETEVWDPDPMRPGTSRRVRTKSVAEVRAELTQHLGEWPEGGEGGLTLCYWAWPGYASWPRGRIVVYALRGSNEGDYTYIEVHRDDGSLTLLM